MNNEQELSSEQSLAIIHQMIQKAKANITDNGSGWLVWGSMIFLASLATYFLALFEYEMLFLAWNIFGIISVFLLTYDLLKSQRKKVRSFIDDVLRWVDIGFAICLFVIIISMNISVSPNDGFGYLLMLYAFLMVIQGGTLKFKPLLLGAAVNWIGAVAIFFNTDFKYDMLISSAAVFIGYIIPGIMLRAKPRTA